ncbi:MAG: hypothetical protein J7K08_04800, partial [Thermoplasmata archaeon]|nr:hypothetical protein [Thermoplasmata archaeon]
VRREFVNVEGLSLAEKGAEVALSGPEGRRVRGELTVTLEGEGEEVLSRWRRRVAVKGSFKVSVPLDLRRRGATRIRAAFSRGEIKSERVLRLREEKPTVEEKTPTEAPRPEITKEEAPKEEERPYEAQLKVSLHLPEGSAEGLYPSERVAQVFKVGSVTVKRLSSPTLLIEGSSEERDVRSALFTLLYLSDEQRARWRELLKVIEGLTSIYGAEVGEDREVEWFLRRVGEVASGSSEALERVSERVERELKALRNLKVRDEREALQDLRRALGASREELKEALDGLKGDVDLSAEALPRAVSAELKATLGVLRYFFLWERGVWRDYPSLSAQERRFIKGAVEAVESTLKRLGRIQALVSDIISRNRQNQPVREALRSLSRLEAELEGLDGRTLKSGEAASGLLRIRCGSGRLSLHLSFHLSSNLALRRPIASYSGGALKTESFTVEGEQTIPVVVELLKGPGDSEARMEITLVPELPPLIRELELK